jgi:hypothetical protein
MTRESRIELVLPRILEDLGAGPPPDYTEALLARTAATRQRPAWAGPGGWFTTVASDGRVDSPRRTWRIVAIAALIIVALTAGAVLVGAWQAMWPDRDQPLRGLVVYASGGDIHIGDPVTGATTSMTTGPMHDASPVFSPDGTHVAFLRDDRVTGGSRIVVVRPDGSDMRVITPEFQVIEPARQPRDPVALGVVFGWSPDGGSVVVGDGKLMTYDALGLAEPRDLAALLPASASLQPGSVGLGPWATMVPFLQPGTGDILFAECGGLSEVASDGTQPSPVMRRSWPRVGPWSECSVPSEPTWSPDGSRIAFIDRIEAEPYISRAYLVDADGEGLRRLAADPVVPEGHVMESDPAWSPDGSKVAVERTLLDHGSTLTRTSWVTIVDIDSGAERDLDATRSSFVSNSGWSWSPDGRSILILMREKARPLVIDIGTGRTTELPWETDTLPSWQRLPAG